MEDRIRSDSEELGRNSQLGASALIEVGNHHRKGVPKPLEALLRSNHEDASRSTFHHS